MLLGTVLLLAVVLAACGGAPEPTSTAAPTAAPVEVKPTVEVPNLTAWEASAHNEVDGEPFRHWDSADPAEVPTTCAKCHSTAGFEDFVGADGSAIGTVDAAVPAHLSQGIQCVACHNTAAQSLTSVTFPSGKVVNTSETGEAICMSCHQGRESKTSVDKQIADFSATDVDTVPAPIKDANGKDKSFGFLNIHYFAAGATLYGSQAEGGYQYDGKVYDPKFRHVEGIDTCIACHDQHATQVRVEKCTECHENVKSADDLKNIRQKGSLVDYNGNGDVTEGIAAEISGLQDTLYSSIQTYASEVAGAPIVYDTNTYPYFFAADTNGQILKDDKGNGYDQVSSR